VAWARNITAIVVQFFWLVGLVIAGFAVGKGKGKSKLKVGMSVEAGRVVGSGSAEAAQEKP
jgi:hypothetical protein